MASTGLAVPYLMEEFSASISCFKISASFCMVARSLFNFLQNSAAAQIEHKILFCGESRCDTNYDLDEQVTD